MEKILRGKILKGVGGLYSVRIISEGAYNARLVQCRARGNFRYKHETPLAGDFVTVCYADNVDGTNEKNFVINEICDRRNALIRPPLANLDYLFVTVAAACPAPVTATVDKLIFICEHNNIEPVIVITKCELNESRARELLNIYSKCGFEAFMLSSVENINISSLQDFIEKNLPCKTAAFAGASGIGKSTLLNRLFPELRLETAEISRKTERGRHTTREVRLFPVFSSHGEGYIADTPGFSLIDFNRFDFFEKEDLVNTVREFKPFIGKCRYTKCTHTKEQGCAIIDAVKSGIIPLSRHRSYVEIYEILKSKKEWN